MIDVINKADLPGVTANEWPGAIAISAKKGEGLDALLEAIRLKLRGAARPMRAVIPLCAGRPAGENTRRRTGARRGIYGGRHRRDGVGRRAALRPSAAQLGEQAVTWQD